ncbi:NUDIX hydrolase [Candidatus Woesearchaeota archaeon]|nr:NUDIX hydrolase [Candidatus Woesearchaeota archaeon]
MSEKRPRVGAAVLVEHEGKLLLGERNKVNANGLWIIPGGGVDFGETLEEAAIREIKEETNLDVDIVKFLCWKEIINVPGNYHGMVFFFLAKAKNLNELEAKEDLSEVKFFSVDEIKELNVVGSVTDVLTDCGFMN